MNSFRSLKLPVRLNLSALAHQSEPQGSPCCQSPASPRATAPGTHACTSMVAMGGKARGSTWELLCVGGGPCVFVGGPGGPVPVCDALPPSLPPCVSPRRPGARCRAVEDIKLQTLSLDGWPSCIKGPKVPGRSSDLGLRVKSGPRRSRQGKWEHSCCGEGPFPCASFGAWVTCVLPTQRAAALRPTELPIFPSGRIVYRFIKPEF